MHSAARYADSDAVEKAWKANTHVAVMWTDVEIVADGNGAPKVVLHGEAEHLFSGSKLSLSLSHSKNSAIAVALLSDL